MVARLREQGAIVLGKTETTQFACFDPAPTRNPWNLEHTPGGSSSGSAAAVAMEMCSAALGSQTGGSITRPATYCGIAGLKPTIGAVSLAGVLPISERLDHMGPMARSVEDLALMFLAIRDTGYTRPAAPAARRDELRQAYDTFLRECLTVPRFQLLEEFFFTDADSEVSDAVREAVQKLRASCLVDTAPALPRSFADVHRMHRRIMAYDAARYHREEFAAHPQSYLPNVSALIEEGLALSRADYDEALEHQERFRREIESSLGRDAIAVMPATDTTAPAGLGSTGDPKFQSPWSYAGLPSVCVPCGLAGSSGMPCGVQLVGPPGSELRLLAAASWCQGRFHFNARPPG